METPGTPWPFWPSANIQPHSTISAGFMNSDGCSDRPANWNHRAAPLALWPTNGRASIISMVTR